MNFPPDDEVILTNVALTAAIEYDHSMVRARAAIETLEAVYELANTHDEKNPDTRDFLIGSVCLTMHQELGEKREPMVERIRAACDAYTDITEDANEEKLSLIKEVVIA